MLYSAHFPHQLSFKQEAEKPFEYEQVETEAVGKTTKGKQRTCTVEVCDQGTALSG